jgi:hypothetical protein
LAFASFPIAGAIASAGIILMTVRTISSTSVHFTGTSRLPMVAGWDRLLPVWFTRLHPKYKTPINSVVFVGIITLVIAISSQIGAGIQEAFQLVDNAANVFFAIVYLSLFVFPFWGVLLFVPARRCGCESRRRVAVVFQCLPFSSPSILSSTCRTPYLRHENRRRAFIANAIGAGHFLRRPPEAFPLVSSAQQIVRPFPSAKTRELSYTPGSHTLT